MKRTWRFQKEGVITIKVNVRREVQQNKEREKIL